MRNHRVMALAIIMICLSATSSLTYGKSFRRLASRAYTVECISPDGNLKMIRSTQLKLPEKWYLDGRELRDIKSEFSSSHVVVSESRRAHTARTTYHVKASVKSSTAGPLYIDVGSHAQKVFRLEEQMVCTEVKSI